MQIDCANYSPSRITTQSKTTYLEEEEHQFIIYYKNQKAHRFTFADNGLTLVDEAQCMKYLQYVKNTLKTNMATFNLYFHKHAFGEIPKPTWDKNSKSFISMLPFTVYTYRR